MNILEAAEASGSSSNMTILIAGDGHIKMFADSDWPLDSLTWHHGAKTAYRVTEQTGVGSVRVEGREGMPEPASWNPPSRCRSPASC